MLFDYHLITVFPISSLSAASINHNVMTKIAAVTDHELSVIDEYVVMSFCILLSNGCIFTLCIIINERVNVYIPLNSFSYHNPLFLITFSLSSLFQTFSTLYCISITISHQILDKLD